MGVSGSSCARRVAHANEGRRGAATLERLSRSASRTPTPRSRRPLPRGRARGTRESRPHSGRMARGLARARARRDARSRRRRARVRALGRERRARLPRPERDRRGAARRPAGERAGRRRGPDVPDRACSATGRAASPTAGSSPRSPRPRRGGSAIPTGGPKLAGTNPLSIAIPSTRRDARSSSTCRWGTSPTATSSPGARARTTSRRSAATQAHKAFALAVGLQLLVDALTPDDGFGAVLARRARPQSDPVPAFRELARGRPASRATARPGSPARGGSRRSPDRSSRRSSVLRSRARTASWRWVSASSGRPARDSAHARL